MGRKRIHNRNLPERVYFKHSKYYFVDSNNKWNNLGADYYSAMIKFAEINSKDNPLKTLNQVIDQYIKTVLKDKSLKTQKDYLNHIDPIRKVFGDMFPKDIKASEIYKYMSMRPKVSANREKAILSQIFKLAIQYDLLEHNPCKQVSSNPEKARDREITDQEFLAVYEMAPIAVQNAMDIALITGLRQGDILKLTVTENWTKEGLKVKTGKTGQKMLFDRTPVLETIVKRCIEAKSQIHSIYLIRNTHGYPYSSSGFQSVFYKLMNKAVKDKGIERFQFRDIRARAGTESDNEKFLGHSDPSTYYRIYRRGTLNVIPIEPKILDKLENIRQGKMKSDRK